MPYTDLIFDLYGTLVDIHTEESPLVWEKTALYFSYYGAHYTGEELQAAFSAALARREAQAGQSYECFPDIPIEQVMAGLFREKGVADQADALGFQAAQLFRIAATEYLRLYPQVVPALEALRGRGCRLWLLSNAQRAFTAYELKALGLEGCFNGVYLSSDYGCRKPDARFFRALLQEQGLDPKTCLMIGNDRATDIAGAQNAGIDTFYMHTALTPADQLPAKENCPMEHEGDDWQAILPRLLALISETDPQEAKL